MITVVTQYKWSTMDQVSVSRTVYSKCISRILYRLGDSSYIFLTLTLTLAKLELAAAVSDLYIPISANVPPISIDHADQLRIFLVPLLD